MSQLPGPIPSRPLAGPVLRRNSQQSRKCKNLIQLAEVEISLRIIFIILVIARKYFLTDIHKIFKELTYIQECVRWVWYD